jgi:hypothetical protein
MGAIQFELGTVVVKAGGLPASGGMAGRAVGAQPSLVRIILRVTGEAILACRLQGRKTRRHDMAFGARYCGMLAVQGESKLVVIEIVAETIHPIMAIETILSKGRLVLRHEWYIHLEVTGATGQHVELGDICPVTICAQERFFLSRSLVAV